MSETIKLVAADVDGTFVHDDYYFDEVRFKRILANMKKAGCNFVVASGNQYYQLRDLFPDYHEELSFVAENGAFIKDKTEMVFAADIPKETVAFATDLCHEYPEINNVLCGVKSAYCERGRISREYFDFIHTYYHNLEWTDDFKTVDDQILKFAPTVPEERTDEFYEMFRVRLGERLVPTSSGHGSIDLIVPGCHKAWGISQLVERWGISPDECAAFGDGGNDIEMLRYCGHSFAMDNAGEDVKAAAKEVCPSNNDDGVLVTLERWFG